MNERKNATTRFTLEALSPSTAQVKAMRQRQRQRQQRADAQTIDYSNTPELSDKWFLRAAHKG